MKKTFILVCAVMAQVAFAQIKFEKGTVTDNTGQQKTVYIKNLDWKKNPTTFEYKTDLNSSEILTGDIKDYQLFEIDGELKYLRSTVQVDKSSFNINNADEMREPEYVEKTIFLEELVGGDRRLFRYNDGAETRFFYTDENGSIKQLVYKPYYISDMKVSYNNDFRKQMSSALNCSGTSSNYNNVEYKQNDLTKAFTEYHNCKTGNTAVAVKEKNSGKINIHLRPRVNFSSYEISNEIINYHNNLDSKPHFGFGVEVEWILPFNKNRWSVITEPSYRQYKAEGEGRSGHAGNQRIAEVDYKAIEIPLGLRHYFFLNDDSRLFLNAQAAMFFPMNSKVNLIDGNGTVYQELVFKQSLHASVGAGYSFKNKYGAEFRYYAKNQTLNHIHWLGELSTFSLILSYNIL